MISRFSSKTFNQSSSRPTMIVQTGPIDLMSLPSISRRCRPRSTASATAMHCGRLKQTVALTLSPRWVASSMAAMPARVAGIFTITFGARRLNLIAFSSIAPASRKYRGSVWIERRPLRPACAANAGSRSFAARTDISSTSFQPIWSSVAPGRSRRSSWIRGRHTAISFLRIVSAMTGFQVAPTAPFSRAYLSSSVSAESFHRHVGVVCVI